VTPRRDIAGLDTLRFVAAVIVALSHGAAFPLRQWLGAPTGWLRTLVGAYDLGFDGVAAVIVFFVISGFCIHLGPASGAPFRVLPFWVRRGVRVAIPLAVAAIVAHSLGAAAEAGLGVVLWSVYCELIYYALYPALRIAFSRFRVGRVLMISSIVSACLIGVGWQTPFYWTFSPMVTWVVAAPAWLLGCVLAEQVAAGGARKAVVSIWLWRSGTAVYAALATAIFFHAPFRLSYPLLLFPFQLLAFGWIRAEIAHFALTPPPAWLEWCGQWSYSLYLVHNIVIAQTPLSPSALAASWAERVAWIAGGALGFYVLVEAPAHWLARAGARRIAGLLPVADGNRPGLAAP
jgi:peptidoglycan/LPS O-acetylase OafA/YrhL